MDLLFDPNRNRMTNMQLCRLYMDEFVKSKERKWMLDVSLAGERYKTPVWDEWDVYPVLNLTYLPKPGHILQLSFSSDKDSIAAMSSILLFVVLASPPDISFSASPYLRMAPQPPGPGLPEHAPSV